MHTRLHSYNGALDFGEAPSVFLENFCWLKEELRDMSCHYTALDPQYLRSWQEKHPEADVPPEKIPDKILDSLLASRSLRQGWKTSDLL